MPWKTLKHLPADNKEIPAEIPKHPALLKLENETLSILNTLRSEVDCKLCGKLPLKERSGLWTLAQKCCKVLVEQSKEIYNTQFASPEEFLRVWNQAEWMVWKSTAMPNFEKLGKVLYVLFLRATELRAHEWLEWKNRLMKQEFVYSEPSEEWDNDQLFISWSTPPNPEALDHGTAESTMTGNTSHTARQSLTTLGTSRLSRWWTKRRSDTSSIGGPVSTGLDPSFVSR